MQTEQHQPIELYYWPTPNGHKITIMLEELGIPYELRFVNIGKGDQFKPEFLAIAPNNKMPAIIDPEGPDGRPISVFESAAILMYLGRKFGRFYPQEERRRVEVEEWLIWQMANVGPVFGQTNHFVRYASEKLPYAITRFVNETHRLYGVLDERLRGRHYVCGDYSIVDMALIGWVRGAETRQIEIDEFPDVKAWIARMEERPAVARALAIRAPATLNLATDEESRKVLFNQRARTAS